MLKLDILKRCEDFACSVILAYEKIPYRKSVGLIGDQLIRSAGSVGANMCEADNARSRKEFLSFVGISLREIKESIFWLSILINTNPNHFETLNPLRQEASEIKLILGKIFQNAKA